jgi:hypothetical protein
MKIPFYPDARPLDLSDKPLLDSLFRQLQPRVSELTFAGLFLFRKAHEYRLAMLDSSLVILGRGYDGRGYFLPPLGGDIPAALAQLFAAGEELYGADELFAAAGLKGGQLEVTADRDSFDYLYLRDDLARLPGNRFHKKKNRINYFMARHQHQSDIFSARYLDGCMALLCEWGRTAEVEGNRSFRLELEATAEALVKADLLGLEGVVVTVAGAVKAFAIGERLNSETAVCHFEKADPFMEGLSQLVNRDFAARLFQECRYINREQDLGEPGLRNAKLSYHPQELVRKYRARQLRDPLPETC